MSILNVQHHLGSDGSSSTGQTVAVAGSAVTSGNLVVGAVQWGSGTPTLTSVTDDKGNTYNIANNTQNATDTQSQATFWLNNITNAPSTITATFNNINTQFRRILWDEFSGVNAGGTPTDGNTQQALTGNTSADAQTSGSITTTTNGDLIWAAFSDTEGAGATWSAGTGFTILNNGTSADNDNMGSEWQVQSSAGSIAGTFTESVSSRSVVGVIAFKAAAGGGASLVTGWQNESSDVYVSKPQKFSLAPAFVSTFRSAGVAGVAWSGPRDHVKLPPPVSISAPPALGRTPPAAASTIAGMAWAGPRNDEIVKPKTRLAGDVAAPPVVALQPITWSFVASDVLILRDAPIDGPPALGQPVTQPVSIAGIAWLTQRDQDKPAVKVRFESPPAIALVPGTLPPRVAGMAWFEPPDGIRAGKVVPIDAPPASGQFMVQPIGMGWFAQADRDRPVVKVSFDAPPAFGRSFATQSVGISGMAWFAPPDRDRPAVKVTFEAPPAIALTPATLPPRIAGMAWFEPAPDTTVTRKSFDAPPALGRQINAPASTIAGMAWAGPQDAQRAPRIVLDATAPAVVFFTPSAPTGAWLVQQDMFRPRPRISDTAPAGVFTPQSLFVGGWFNEPDAFWSRRPLRETASAQVLRSIAPPVPISGMAWFAPLDRDRTWARVVYDYPPAFDPQFVLSVPPSAIPPERIIKFAAEARGIRFAVETRTIRFGAEGRDIQF